MTQLAEIKGLDELLQRMQAYPTELVKTMAVGMSASLNIFWEKVPPYPKQDPGARYRRTGTLGRSLGSSESGGATSDAPSIYKVKSLGQGNFEGTFGTNLEYAHWVIGEKQAGMHSSNWWNIQTIAFRAADKVEKLWNDIAEKLAKFLEGKNG